MIKEGNKRRYITHGIEVQSVKVKQQPSRTRMVRVENSSIHEPWKQPQNSNNNNAPTLNYYKTPGNSLPDLMSDLKKHELIMFQIQYEHKYFFLLRSLSEEADKKFVERLLCMYFGVENSYSSNEWSNEERALIKTITIDKEILKEKNQEIILKYTEKLTSYMDGKGVFVIQCKLKIKNKK